MLPSELPEDGVIQIRSPSGVVEFHRHYGELRMIAKNATGQPGDCTGIGITDDETLCDLVYQQWADRVHNRDNGKYPAAWHDVAVVEILPGVTNAIG